MMAVISKAGAAQDPEKGDSRFYTGSRFHHPNRSGAHASRHLPQMARAAGHPAMGQLADRAVAAARSAFSFQGLRVAGRGLKGKGL
jgi:hypothetical protein